jgi:thiamine transport system substrate-binding protein
VTLCHKARFALAAAAGAITLLVGAGCGGGGQPKDVVLETHDAFAISPAAKRAFEQESGLKLRILKGGDAGEVVTRALLTAGNPEGDVLFGVDNNLVERTLAGDVFEPYTPPALATVDPALELDPQHRVTPIDHGEVCLNVDRRWYAEKGVPPPRSLGDLTQARYRNQLVVENPATSTPGLAFLLATIARYGDGWHGFWRKLRANGVLVVDGWEEAYTARFSGAAGSHGTRPIVVSYASSPPAEVIFRNPRPATAPTGVVAESCFRQIELAGVLRGAHNEKGAHELVDFLLSPRFQRDIPLQMFVFPARRGVPLPPEFVRYAVVPAHPLELSPAVIDRNRERWVREWTDVVVR